MNLAQYQWKNRILLVFTPSSSDARFEKQVALFSTHASNLEERDILVFPLIGAADVKMRNQFRVAKNEFTVILIGKDGNEKHRWPGIAPIEQIDHRVDRMPMRRSEMQKKQAFVQLPVSASTRATPS